MKKTGTANVWCTIPDFLAEIYDHTDASKLPFATCIVDTGSDMSESGWVKIGTCTVEMDLIDPKDTVAAQVQALEEQCQKVMADSEATLTILRSKINNLLSIEG